MSLFEHRARSVAALLALLALVGITGCSSRSPSRGGSGGQAVSLETGAAVSGDSGLVPGNLGLFQVNGQTYHVDQVGGLRTSGFVSGLDYSGPAGCAGRIFDVNGPTFIFRYTAHNAEMQDGATVFYFPLPPRVDGHTLGWSAHFVGNGENDDVTAVVYCPLPSSSIPPLPESGVSGG